jgi:molybdopterin molybdotransferase
MISVIEAKRIIYERIPSPGKVRVNLAEASGHILAEKVCSPFPMPRFDNSAMDGFAVRAQDTETAREGNPVSLTLAGIVPAGTQESLTVGPRQCAQIMTGAPLPPGADAVVKVEDTSGFEDETTVQVYSSVNPGENVRFKGEEIAKGTPLLSAGTRLTAAEIGVLATFGLAQVEVAPAVRMAILITGDELQLPGQKLGPGQIYNSNLPVLVELSRQAGTEILTQRWLPDDQKTLRKSLQKALETCDVIVTSGGISMGRFDFLREILTSLGVQEHIWKVAQKPGKPLYFGTRGNVLVFGLPGNPVSAFIGFMIWVWPVLEKMQGKEPDPFIEVILTAPFPRDKSKHRFLFGKVHAEYGRLVGQPTEKVGSHMLTSSLKANAILMAEPGKESLSSGKTIEAFLLPWGTLD